MQKICFSKEFCTFLHYIQCKFTLRKNFKSFSKLVLTYGRPNKKCEDFRKNFPKNFDPIFGVAVVKLRFHVAVAVAVGQTTARRGMARFHIILSLEKKYFVPPQNLSETVLLKSFLFLKNFTKPFLISENEQFLNLVKFCVVNNWKLYKVYIWASPIFKVFISLNHWLRKILLDIINVLIYQKSKKVRKFLKE